MKKDKYKSIDQYINQYPEDIKLKLIKLKQIIKEAAPDAKETFFYNAPTFYQGENLVQFAIFKNHIGFYSSPTAIAHFREELKQYKTLESTIRFPFDIEIPYNLIKEIVIYRVNEVKDLNTTT